MTRFTVDDVDNFSKPIHAILGKKPQSEKPSDVILGIEFENEIATAIDMPNIKGFSYHPEGSLRNHGFEYVFSKPSPEKHAKILVERYLEVVTKDFPPLLNSRRASTHIHFDASLYTYEDILKYFIVYSVAEPFLSVYAGPSRQDNLFCQRLQDAKAAVPSFTSELSQFKPYRSYIFSEDYRYASCNLSSVLKFCTIENRLLRATSSKEVIFGWIDLLKSIRTFAASFKTLVEFRDFFIKTPAEEFFNICFAKEPDLNRLLFDTVRDASIQDLFDQMRSNFLALEPIIIKYSSTDFKKAREDAEKAAKSKKDSSTGLIGNIDAAVEAIRQRYVVQAQNILDTETIISRVAPPRVELPVIRILSTPQADNSDTNPVLIGLVENPVSYDI